MGAKASTANNDDSSARDRTFSSDSSDLVSGNSTFDRTISLLRSMPNISTTAERQRARSLSSVRDVSSSNPDDGPEGELPLESEGNSNDDHSLDSPLANINLGRVFAARSLPSHIWSINGIKCPVCSKFVLPDDVECHLVMCLTKPRLMYNEDVLSVDKGECVICLEELEQGDTIARLPCLCIYHKGCIDKWFEVNRSCPEHPGD